MTVLVHLVSKYVHSSNKAIKEFLFTVDSFNIAVYNIQKLYLKLKKILNFFEECIFYAHICWKIV